MKKRLKRNSGNAEVLTYVSASLFVRHPATRLCHAGVELLVACGCCASTSTSAAYPTFHNLLYSIMISQPCRQITDNDIFEALIKADMELIEMGSRRDGYPALAEWVARDPDHETFIFRRFDRLAARNLLNMQSELVEIEDKLNRIDQDSRLGLDAGLMCWETFIEEIEDQDNQGYAKERKRLYDRLERRVKDYRKLGSTAKLKY
jgi:hypothetical protein